MNIVNTARQAYNASVTLAFDYKEKRINIQQEKIAYIMIEHDYENQVLPIIYISLAVNNNLYNNIIKYKDTAKFYLDIQKTNKQSKSSFGKSIISGSFSYIPSTTNPNFRQDLYDNTTLEDSSYRRIMIGLVSIELTNRLRKTFNGIYYDIDQKTLIALALEGTNCVIENIPYNKKYESVLVPPINSRYKMLEFIFNKDNFFDTNFRYFMDFEKSYLVSKCGNYTNAKDGQLDSVIIDIKALTDRESMYDGISVKNGSYYIYINPANANVSINQGTEKVANQIVSIYDDEELQKLDLSINNSEGSETKQIFMRTKNAALYKNELETDTVTIEILKRYIDGSIFTPNKVINVNNYGEYSKYNGKYIIMYKKEFFKCVAGEFIMSCVVGLKKIGNVIPVGSLSSSKSKNMYAISSGASKTTTSSRKIKSNIKSASIK